MAPAAMCGCRRAALRYWLSKVALAGRSSAAGQQQALIPEGMGPGEVYLFTPGGNSVYLRSGGEIELQGKVRIQGSLTVNGEPYAPCES